MQCRHSIPLVLILGLIGPAWATDSKPADVEIWAIRATTKNSDVSPELRTLATALKKQFKYTGYKLEKKSSGRVALGKPFKAKLVGDYEATVTPKERKDGGKRIQLEVIVTKREGKQTKTVSKSTVVNKAGPFLPYGCGSLDGDDYLLVAVRAR